MKRTTSLGSRSALARILLPLLLAGAAAACGPETLDGIDEVDNPIIGGRADTGDPAVIALFAQQPGTNRGSLCTTTLVSPQVLLTAAHCVHPSLVGGGVRFVAVLDPVLRAGGRTAAVRQVRWHSGFNPNNPFAGNDIAVAILATPITNVAPIPINRTALVGRNVGQSARLVGYGNNNGGSPPVIPGSGSGTKRQVTTTIVGFNAGLVQIGRTGAGTCQGDSGGPALGTLGAPGGERVFGVTSFGQQGCRGAGSFTRVDRHTAFLNTFLTATFSAEATLPEADATDAAPAE